MKIDGRFWLTKDDQNFLGSGRIELLEQIQKTGSIHAAAKAMKMSYKAAWERINAMNLLADHPLIEPTKGGKGGGGTLLTPYAHELIATFDRFSELHRQFIDRLAEAGDDPERLARILGRTFLTTSARNQIPAILESVEIIGNQAHLNLLLEGSDKLLSIITAKSVRNMGLVPGCDIYAIIKSSDVFLSKYKKNETLSPNAFEAAVVSIETDGPTSEVTVSLSGNTKVVTVIEHNQYETLSVGEKVRVTIPPLHIIIGM